MKLINLQAVSFAFIMGLVLSACGENKSSSGKDAAVTSSVVIPQGKPELLESFLFEDLEGRPQITFAEFRNQTIVTVRDSDGVRTESLLIRVSDENNKVTVLRGKPGEDWTQLYGAVEPSKISSEFQSFQYYLKSLFYSQVQHCRTAKEWGKAVDAIRSRLDPVLLSIQARRKQKQLDYEAVFEIDPQTSRIVGISVSAGVSHVIADIAYLAVHPEWIFDGRPSSTLLGPLASVELDLACKTLRREREESLRGKLEAASSELLDTEISKRVDGEFRFSPRLQTVYDLFSRRRELQVNNTESARKALRLKISKTDLDNFFATGK